MTEGRSLCILLLEPIYGLFYAGGVVQRRGHARPRPVQPPEVGAQVRQVEGKPRWQTSADDTAWVEVEITGADSRWDWTGYVFRVTLRAGELAALAIERDDESTPLRADRLQHVPLGAIERCARSWLTEAADVIGRGSLGDAYDEPLVDPPLSKDRQRRLAEVALAYVETLGAQNQRELLAERLLCSKDHAPNLVREARDGGMLLPLRPGRGRQVGFLSDKARHILGLEPRHTAWERASEEDRSFAINWVRRLADVARQLAAGEITKDEYRHATEQLRSERFAGGDGEEVP